ncbi:MAG: flagellar basal body-associated FliL family protein [Helicobacteraceae bacterium]
MADTEEEVEEVKDSGGSKKNLLLVIIAVVVLILIVTIVGVILLLGSEENVSAKTASGKPAVTKDMNDVKLGPVVPLDHFIVNLADNSGRRYLKVKIQLELSGSGLMEEVENKTALIRDIIIRTLSSKTYEQVSTENGKIRLKDEIIGNINRKLIDGEVVNIFFTDFVVQ